MSRERNDAASVREWLSRETPAHLGLMTKLREKLEQTMEVRPVLDVFGRPEFDASGKPMMLPADVNEAGTPSRDWCRGLQRYQTGYTTVLVEERERWKLRLQAQQAGLSPELGELTDDQFDAELKELALEAIRQLPEGELQAELKRRQKTEVVDLTEDFG